MFKTLNVAFLVSFLAVGMACSPRAGVNLVPSVEGVGPRLVPNKGTVGLPSEVSQDWGKASVSAKATASAKTTTTTSTVASGTASAQAGVGPGSSEGLDFGPRNEGSPLDQDELAQALGTELNKNPTVGLPEPTLNSVLGIEPKQTPVSPLEALFSRPDQSYNSIWVSIFPIFPGDRFSNDLPITWNDDVFNFETDQEFLMLKFTDSTFVARGKKLQFKSKERLFVVDGRNIPMQDVYISTAGFEGTGITSKVCLTAKTCLGFPGNFVVQEIASGKHKGRMRVVNVVSIQDYLKGVVPAEIYPEFPLEALKAQTIAARTFALFKMICAREYSERCGHDDDGTKWDVRATTADQAYFGFKKKDERTDKAVDETLGQVALYRGRVIQAQFHSNSGGKTCNVSDCGGQVQSAFPYLASVTDASGVRDMSGGERTSTKDYATFIAGLKKMFPTWTGKEVKSIVVKRNDSDRAEGLTINTDLGSLSVLPSRMGEFNRLISKPTPTYYYGEFQISSTQISLPSFGYGHGVGMCQMGTKLLANNGSNSKKIIEFYYPGVKVTNVSGQQVRMASTDPFIQL